ncbi:MAG: two-component system response regulator [Deltaproteobacteria bacterium CG03_land_8_20_14_0_80_45_14]|nr:MAG: two-component system response regulator [Deltaproteobacteria bacterium CG03_land_8_20_14_0_80_45_14]
MEEPMEQKKRRASVEDRILIVDDEEVICNILARRLTREGYSCVAAHNGKEALRHFYKDSFSLIISDIKMPEMDGIELLKKVKAVHPNMLVIMVTAYPEIDLALEAMRLGAYDFIIKPADMELVVLSVKKALEKKRLEEELDVYHKNLEKLVEERTVKLQLAYRTLKKAYLDSVKVLAEAIDAKDPYTRGHSDRVRRMSLRITASLGFTEERMEILEYGALLHDIGKIGIKDEILRKPGALTPEEYQTIQEHPLIGVKIVEGIEFFKDKIPMIRNHHEHFDGKGYPDGLAGETIPLEARIIAVPDAFDAMASLRPYRSAMPLEDILLEMEKYKGKQFDPKILEIFLREKIYKL